VHFLSVQTNTPTAADAHPPQLFTGWPGAFFARKLAESEATEAGDRKFGHATTPLAS
jgi:hypothetical protein